MPPARFQDLYDRHAGSLFRFALALTGNRAEAEDLVADTFVRLWTAPGELRETTVKAYLVTILRNLFFTRRKQAARHVALDESQPADERGQDDRANAALELASVRQHLALLPDLDRAALLMRGGEGRSYERSGGPWASVRAQCGFVSIAREDSSPKPSDEHSGEAHDHHT